MEDVKIKLSALWVAHFMIWTYGDMLRLIHPGFIEEIIDDPATNELILFVAAPLGIIQALLIVGSVLLDNDGLNRKIHLVMGGLFGLINVGHIFDVATNNGPAWEYLLVAVYLLFNAMVIRVAKEWQVTT